MAARRAILHIIEAGWTGWSREQPAAKSVQVRVTPGILLTPALFGGNMAAYTEIPCLAYKLMIVAIWDRKIVLTFDRLVIENQDGTINLSAPRQGSCTLSLGEELKFATPTMDGGINVKVTLSAIE